MNKTLVYGSYLVILMAFFLLGYIFYLSFYPFNIVTLHKSPMPVLNEENLVKEEETLDILMDFTKHLDFPAKITFSIVDGFVYGVPGGEVKRPVGDFNKVRNIYLPEKIPNGEYLLQIDILYKITPIRTLSYTWYSEKFTINR